MINLKKYEWGSNGHCNYKLLKDNKIINQYHGESCFARFDKNPTNTFDTVQIELVTCDLTRDYQKEFLQYIIDMLKIEASFDDDYFTFKNTGNYCKNLLICSLTRLLWETMWQMNVHDNLNLIIIPTLKGKSKYRNKLARFCDIFSRIEPLKNNYLHTGHLWDPTLMKIKYTKDFWEETFNSVNSFFNKEK